MKKTFSLVLFIAALLAPPGMMAQGGITLPWSENFDSSVIDLNGREVYRQEAVAQGETIDMATLSRGVYFVRIVNATSHAVAKLIVR